VGGGEPFWGNEGKNSVICIHLLRGGGGRVPSEPSKGYALRKAHVNRRGGGGQQGVPDLSKIGGDLKGVTK